MTTDLTTPAELDAIRLAVDRIVDEEHGDGGPYSLENLNDDGATLLDKLAIIRTRLGDYRELMPAWCTCGEDYAADCACHGPAARLEFLAELRTHDPADLDQHFDAIEAALRAEALADRVPVPCPRCNGGGMVGSADYANLCPVCDGNHRYLLDT